MGLYKRWHWILWDRHTLKGLLDDLFTHLPFPRRENAPVEGRDLVQFSPVFLAPVMVHGTQNMADKCFSARLKYPPANFWTDFFFSISSFPSDSPHCCLTLVLISQRAQLWQGTKRLPHCQIQDSLLSPHTRGCCDDRIWWWPFSPPSNDLPLVSDTPFPWLTLYLLLFPQSYPLCSIAA